MPRLSLARRYHFSASHRLNTLKLSPEANRDVYGKCNHPFGHGHDYILEVRVAGEPDPRTGRLVPLHMLDRLVEQQVLIPMNRRDLNTQIEEFASLVPTTENLTAVIVRRLKGNWHATFPDRRLFFEKVKIWETARNIIEMEAPLAAAEERS